MPEKPTAPAESATLNAVTLRGRVSSAPIERHLPSGDRILTFRMVVGRVESPMTRRSRQVSDWFDCAVWDGHIRQAAAGWQVGDVVQVEGALRRRFFRAGATTSTRLEVEVLSGHLVGTSG